MTTRQFLAGLLAALLWAGGPSHAIGQQTIYVDVDAIGANNGSSWEDAFVYLQDALVAAQAGDEVWVAEGVYRPDEGLGIEPGDRRASFFLKSDVGLYGGFIGAETIRTDRAATLHPTVLSGTDGVSGSLHVAQSTTTGRSAVLDGFTIRDGRATDFVSGILGPQSGGGLFNDGGRPTLRNLVFESNRASYQGGAIYSTGGVPLVIGCTFLGNTVNAAGGAWGGAIRTENGSITIIGSHFAGNEAIGRENAYGRLVGRGYGGAVSIENGTAAILNSVFVDNHTAGERMVRPTYSINGTAEGAAIHGSRAIVSIVNSTIADNTATTGQYIDSQGGGIHVTGELNIRNSIIWGNAPDQLSGNPADAEYSIIEGGYAGAAILDLDPMLEENFGLSGLSPAIGGGLNAALPPDSLDLDGDGNLQEPWPVDGRGAIRIYDPVAGQAGGAVDLGAFEYGAPVASIDVETGSPRVATTKLSVFPNPASDRSTIRFTLPHGARVRLAVYDALGRQRVVLDESWMAPGEHAAEVSTGNLPTGAYLVRLNAGVIVATTSIVVMR